MMGFFDKLELLHSEKLFLFSAEKLIQCIHPQHEDAEDEEDAGHTGAEHREGDGKKCE